jgi:glycosyltransferase involved in cell wall biosynthesis
VAIRQEDDETTVPDVRVLVVGVTFPFPPRSGFEMRFSQLLRQLARRYDVTLLSYAPPRADVSAAPDGLRVEVVPRRAPVGVAKRRAQLLSLASPTPFAARDARSAELQEVIDRLTAEQAFDVVQLESILLWGLRFPPGTRVVLDEHNVEYEVFARMRAVERSRARRVFYGVERVRVQRFEQAAWKRVDACVVTSPREEEMVHAVAPETPVTTVPNAVDADYFRPGGVDVRPASLVFNGVLDYRPNVDAVEFMLDEVMPLIQEQRPEVELSIVGRGGAGELHRFRRAGVVVTGEVPDVRPHLEQAAVVVVPIRMGGGTRLKVLEGLALERPMVSTSLGCEGIAVENDQHLLIADGAEAFAAAVLRLFDDPELSRQLGRNGRELVRRDYSWDAAGTRLEALYDRVLARPPRAAM